MGFLPTTKGLMYFVKRAKQIMLTPLIENQMTHRNLICETRQTNHVDPFNLFEISIPRFTRRFRRIRFGRNSDGRRRSKAGEAGS